MYFLTFFFLLFVSFESGHAQRNVFVRLSKGPESVLDAINQQSFSNRADRAAAVRSALIAHAAQTQSPLLNFLQRSSIFGKLNYESFWLSNEIFIKGAPSGILSSLQNLFGGAIASITDEAFATFNTDFIQSPKQSSTQNFTWGVKRIQVPEAWALEGANNGNGVIVAGIDSGVQYTHEALRDNFVGANGWFDAAGRSTVPTDTNGHGTHTMGTIVGANGIGVAPGARWIACRGCLGSGCSDANLKRCAQWIICPTDVNGKNPDCKKTPVVVNNSWGFPIRSDSWLSTIKAWIAAGIVPIVSNGNSGPGCCTTAAPAHLAESIGIGSTTIEDDLSSFSSKGPIPRLRVCLPTTVFAARIKPDISGPGSDVYSAWIGRSNKEYNTISGTSMSGPHVAGVVALMFGANRGLTVAAARDALNKGATTKNLKRKFIGGCFLAEEYPNNVYGHGLVNAKNSVNIVLGNKVTGEENL